jgi:2-oxoglutarate dehydrogenase E1 component
MKDFSYITHSHPSYIEGLYQDFVKNPESVDPEFRRFFEGFDFAINNGGSTNGHDVAENMQAAAKTSVDAGQLQKSLQYSALLRPIVPKGTW